MKTVPKKQKTVSQLKKQADAVFSQYIRKSAADFAGYASCVTCGLSKPWQEQQAGHYESRAANELRFDERNVHVQCVGCNVFKKGNYPRYAIYMVNTYGPGILTELEEEAKPIKHFKTWELEEIISMYKLKIGEL